jgi:Na+/phosphate symporter
MSELTALEKSNNQFTNFCERLLIKKGYDATEKTCFKYLLAWNVEKVCDCYKDLCELIDREQISSFPSELLSMYNEVLSYFRGLYNLIYSFDLKEVDRLFEQESRISARILSYKPKKAYEHRIAYILNEIVNRVTNFSTASYGLNCQVKD